MHGEVQATCVPVCVSARVTYEAEHLPAVIRCNLLIFGERGNRIKVHSTFFVQSDRIINEFVLLWQEIKNYQNILFTNSMTF